MVRINFISNVFKPEESKDTYEFSGGQNIWYYLKEIFGLEFKEFETATVCVKNGQSIMRVAWDEPCSDGDVLEFVEMPGGFASLGAQFFALKALFSSGLVALPGATTALFTSLGLAGAGLVLLNNLDLFPDINDPSAGRSETYNLGPGNTLARVNEPIEVNYGHATLFPRYAAKPYTSYRNNDQYLTQLMVIGQGDYDTANAEIKIGDTPINDFEGSPQYRFFKGTDTRTDPLYPIYGVETNSEVKNIRLYAPNEDDFPDDGWHGPWVMNKVGTKADKLQLDITFPAGLYSLTSKNKRIADEFQPVYFQVQIQQADNDGNGVGNWQTLVSTGRAPTLRSGEESITNSPTTGLSLKVRGKQVEPIAVTEEFTVPPAFGRYRLRIRRATNRKMDGGSFDSDHITQSILESAKTVYAKPASVTDFGDVTLLESRIKSTQNINTGSATQVSVKIQRQLPVYDSTAQTWSSPQNTRNRIWALCDMCRATYGGNLPASSLNLNALAELAADYETENDYFDYSFTRGTVLWSALKTIVTGGRALPIIQGNDGRITLVRDTATDTPTAIFNKENINIDTLSWPVRPPTDTDYDGVKVEYFDAATNKQETVLCLLDGEAGDNPERIILRGTTDRQKAFEFGCYARAKRKYIREGFNFSTTREGYIPQIGNLVAFHHPIPKLDGVVDGVVERFNTGTAESTPTQAYTDVPLSTGKLRLTLPDTTCGNDSSGEVGNTFEILLYTGSDSSVFCSSIGGAFLVILTVGGNSNSAEDLKSIWETHAEVGGTTEYLEGGSDSETFTSTVGFTGLAFSGGAPALVNTETAYSYGEWDTNRVVTSAEIVDLNTVSEGLTYVDIGSTNFPSGLTSGVVYTFADGSQIYARGSNSRYRSTQTGTWTDLIPDNLLITDANTDSVTTPQLLQFTGINTPEQMPNTVWAIVHEPTPGIQRTSIRYFGWGYWDRTKTATVTTTPRLTTTTVLELSDEVNFEVGTNYQIAVRDNLGGLVGPFTATPGNNNFEVTIPNANYDSIVIEDNKLNPWFTFGPENAWARFCKVLKISPSSNHNVKIDLEPYDSRVYNDNWGTAPVIGEVPEGFTPIENPEVDQVWVEPRPGNPSTVTIKWSNTEGAVAYRVTIQPDGDDTEEIPITTTSNLWHLYTSFPQPDVKIRIYGIGESGSEGDPALWTGDIGNRTDAPLDLTGLDVTPRPGALEIEWTKTEDIYSYRTEIDLSTVSSFADADTLTLDVPWDLTPYTVINLDSDLEYYIRIRALDSFDNTSSYTTHPGAERPEAQTAGGAGTPGTDAVLYYIQPTNGTAIKDGTGTLTVEAHKITGDTNVVLSTGTIRLYDPSNNILGNGYTATLNSGNISGSIVITLKDGPWRNSIRYNNFSRCSRWV